MYVCDQNLKYVHNVHLYAFFDTYKFVEQKKKRKDCIFPLRDFRKVFSFLKLYKCSSKKAALLSVCM